MRMNATMINDDNTDKVGSSPSRGTTSLMAVFSEKARN